MQQLNGQITISGVVNFPSGLCLAAEIKAHPDNTDTIWIGNDGNDTISNTTGYLPLLMLLMRRLVGCL